MAETEKKKTLFREDFPGYQGHVPYKYSIIGATIGSTNDQIKTLLTTEPPKKVLLKPSEMQDYSIYNRDYFCDNFTRDYPLEEDKIFSNRSQKADTWIQGDKYKIYPQHIPGVKVFVPGLYSSNLYGYHVQNLLQLLLKEIIIKVKMLLIMKDINHLIMKYIKNQKLEVIKNKKN